jgi:hypothetical protein
MTAPALWAHAGGIYHLSNPRGETECGLSIVNNPAQLDLLAREGRLCFVALMQGSRVEPEAFISPNVQCFDRNQPNFWPIDPDTLRIARVKHRN